MNLSTILVLLTTHFVADFMFQSGSMATNKSTDNGALTLHVFVYTMIWFFTIPWTLQLFENSSQVANWLLFCVITGFSHWITDYLTSRIVSQKFKDKEYYTSLPNLGAFTIIGFDQLLHYAQIFITYKILFL